MASSFDITNPNLQRKPGYRRSISFSIAYVRVCEWVREPDLNPRPKPDILEKALDHAERLGDPYIIEKIQECYDHYKEVESTPTPKLPGPTPESIRESREITGKIRQSTEPYSLLDPDESRRLDAELDDFIREMELKGL